MPPSLPFCSCVAFAANASATETACNGHTDATARTCSSTCKPGEILHVSMNLDDPSEQGDVGTACASTGAQCATDPGLQSTEDWCWDDSEVTTVASAPWTCHFEAHDVWFQPNNGFLYECSWYPKSGRGGAVDCTSALVDCDPAFNCRGIVPGSPLTAGVATQLCDEIATGRVLGAGTTAGVAVRYEDGAMFAVSCARGMGCALAQPACEVTGRALACDVSPGRLE